MMESFSVYLADEAQMVAFGKHLGESIPGGVIYLEGDLGAGKTTLCRGILRARGYQGAVKSPTYTLVEPYELSQGTVFHFDLYRLGDPEELEYLGIRDYFDGESLCLVEWPERGEGVLPNPDLTFTLSVEGHGRGVVIMPQSEYGDRLLDTIRSWRNLQ